MLGRYLLLTIVATLFWNFTLVHAAGPMESGDDLVELELQRTAHNMFAGVYREFVFPNIAGYFLATDERVLANLVDSHNALFQSEINQYEDAKRAFFASIDWADDIHSIAARYDEIKRASYQQTLRRFERSFNALSPGAKEYIETFVSDSIVKRIQAAGTEYISAVQWAKRNPLEFEGTLRLEVFVSNNPGVPLEEAKKISIEEFQQAHPEIYERR